MSIAVSDKLVVRRAQAADVEPCARICYEAFTRLNQHHNFPADFPDPSAAVHVLTMMFSHPKFYCVVAELDGKIAGSNCMDERSSIAGIGPITIDPATQNRAIGRRLMLEMMYRVRERGMPGVRLVQAAFHNRSLSLYAKLGFEVREPLAVMQGPPLAKPLPAYQVRPAAASDLEACNTLCFHVHGHNRGGELRDGIEHGSAQVAEFDGRITAYTSGLGFFGHTVAESNRDLQALISAADAFAGPGMLVPVRNAELFRWCLASGLRVVEPMTLMTVGLYQEPAGAWLPSILY